MELQLDAVAGSSVEREEGVAGKSCEMSGGGQMSDSSATLTHGATSPSTSNGHQVLSGSRSKYSTAAQSLFR